MTERPQRRSQADRSEETRRALIDAAIASLIVSGHAKTTAVEICRRAGLTRGALFHHFASLPELLAAAMSDAYDRHFLNRQSALPFNALDEWVDVAWARLSQPVFKAVIEVWLAARNAPEMTAELMPAIAKYKDIFSISENENLRRRIGTTPEAQAFYQMAAETMIGLALGRATTPAGAALAHETIVINMLKTFARQMDQ